MTGNKDKLFVDYMGILNMYECKNAQGRIYIVTHNFWDMIDRLQPYIIQGHEVSVNRDVWKHVQEV